MHMTTKLFTAYDNTSLVCAIWDDVSNPIGVVQIIHGVFDTMQTYDKLAHFLNRNGYIVFGIDKPLCRTPRSFDCAAQHEMDIMQYLVRKYMLPIFFNWIWIWWFYHAICVAKRKNSNQCGVFNQIWAPLSLGITFGAQNRPNGC